MKKIFAGNFEVVVNTEVPKIIRGFGCLKCQEVVTVVTQDIEVRKVRGLVRDELNRHVATKHRKTPEEFVTLLGDGKVMMTGIYLESGSIN